MNRFEWVEATTVREAVDWAHRKMGGPAPEMTANGTAVVDAGDVPVEPMPADDEDEAADTAEGGDGE